MRKTLLTVTALAALIGAGLAAQPARAAEPPVSAGLLHEADYSYGRPVFYADWRRDHEEWRRHGWERHHRWDRWHHRHDW